MYNLLTSPPKLSNKRRVVVSKFKGNMFVNIREFYEDASGEMKPGKKVRHRRGPILAPVTRAHGSPNKYQGIMLSIDQYKALAGLVPAINDELRKKGVSIDGKENDSDESDEQHAKPTKKSKDKSVSKKANIEATSDEDENND